MTFMVIANLCSWLTVTVSVAWVIRVFANPWGWNAPPIVSGVFFNLRPFYFPALAVATLYDLLSGEMRAVDYFLNAIAWLGGYMMRNDHDDEDRWKRRREKLAAKIQEQGGKLVVVPVGANA